MTKKEFDPKIRKLQKKLGVSNAQDAFEILDKMFALMDDQVKFKVDEINEKYYRKFIRPGLPSHQQSWQDRNYK